MRGLIPSLVAALAALVSCSADAARTGVVGNTLTTNVRPYVSVRLDTAFTLLGAGKTLLAAKTDITTDEAAVWLHYAMFAADAGDGPQKRFAWTAVARLETPKAWRFQPGGTFPGAFSANVPGLEPAFAGQWSGSLLRITADGDWTSGVLAENAQAAPNAWLAARWILHLNDATKVLAEYREPWPEDIDPQNMADPRFLRDAALDYFDAFTRRAKAAFTVTKDKGDFKTASETPLPHFALPRSRPVVAQLIGEVVSLGNDGR